MSQRLNPEHRKSLILNAAISDAKRHGILNITHGTVAARCGIKTSKATVLRYFPTGLDLVNAVRDNDEGLDKEATLLGVAR